MSGSARKDSTPPGSMPSSSSGPADPLAVTVTNAGDGYSLGDLDAPPSGDESMAALLGGIAHAPSALPPIELANGAIVDRSYRIVRPLGSGGMGVVYLARDLDLQRDVALKIHRASAGLDRLQREAVAMAQLAHPNVLTVHAVGQIQGRLYIAMEYVPGATLRSWLEAEPRAWRAVTALLVSAGEGLAAAHDAGFVHRDFKPDNVLVGRDGRPRVGDFGLVRVAGDLATTSGTFHAPDSLISPPMARDDSVDPATTTLDARPPKSARPSAPDSATPMPLSDLTATGAALGTPAYMAPEQFVGGDVDASADQFSFCVVLYESLCGRRPFPGDTYNELRTAVTEGDPLPPPRGRAPAWLWRVLRRGLARDPAARWPDMRALLEALRSGPGRRIRTGAIAAVVVLAAAGGVLLATRPTDVVAAAPSCDHAGDAVDQLWNPQVAKEMTAHLAGLDPTIGPGHAERIRRTIDRWTASFHTAAEQACRAEHVERSWSTRTATQSLQCRIGALAGLRDTIAAGRALARDRLPRFAGEVHDLIRVKDCLDERLLLADYQLPDDPEVAAAAERLYRRLYQIEGLLERGQVVEARSAHAAIQSELDDLAFPPVQALGLRVDGAIAHKERRFDVAIDRFERAYGIARAAGADAIALESVRLLIWLQGVEMQQVDAARSWIVQGVPEAERYGLDHPPAAALIHAAAVVAEIDADYERAISLQRRMVEVYRSHDSVNLPRALAGLGTALDASGRSAEAIPLYEEALALIERDFGAEDPKTVWIRSNIAIAKIASGDVEGGLAVTERGIALLVRQPGVEAYDASNLRFNHAYALESNGRRAEAVEVYRQVRAELVVLSGEDSGDVADVDANLGNLELNLGEIASARIHLEHALKVRRKSFGEDHDQVATVYTHLGGLELGDRGCSAAVPYYQRAVDSYRAVAARAGAPMDRIASPLLGLAQCRLRAADVAGALELVVEARERADHLGDRGTRYVAARLHGWTLVAAGRNLDARAAFTGALGLLAAGDPEAASDRKAIEAWLAANPP